MLVKRDKSSAVLLSSTPLTTALEESMTNYNQERKDLKILNAAETMRFASPATKKLDQFRKNSDNSRSVSEYSDNKRIGSAKTSIVHKKNTLRNANITSINSSIDESIYLNN